MIKSLLNKGSEYEKPLEKIADAFLYLPRKMWLGKSVKIINIGDKTVMRRPLDETPTDKLSKLLHSDSYAPLGIGVLLTPAYCVAAIVLSIPLGIGLLLKEISIHTDKKARLYSKAVNEALTNEKLSDELDQIEIRLGDDAREFTPEEQQLFHKKAQLEQKINQVRERSCLKAYLDEIKQ